RSKFMPRTSPPRQSSKRYRIPADVNVHNSREVNAYLKRHGDLAKLVSPICQSTRKEFGAQAELCLEVYRDPEIPERHLVLFVRLRSYDNETMERIYKITEAFDRELSDSSGWFQVTLDF